MTYSTAFPAQEGATRRGRPRLCVGARSCAPGVRSPSVWAGKWGAARTRNAASCPRLSQARMGVSGEGLRQQACLACDVRKPFRNAGRRGRRQAQLYAGEALHGTARKPERSAPDLPECSESPPRSSRPWPPRRLPMRRTSCSSLMATCWPPTTSPSEPRGVLSNRQVAPAAPPARSPPPRRPAAPPAGAPGTSPEQPGCALARVAGQSPSGAWAATGQERRPAGRQPQSTCRAWSSGGLSARMGRRRRSEARPARIDVLSLAGTAASAAGGTSPASCRSSPTGRLPTRTSATA